MPSARVLRARAQEAQKELAASVTRRPATASPSPLDVEGLRERVDAALAAVLEREFGVLGFLGEDLEPVAEALRTFVLAGGKRLRPAFVYWGYRGAGGAPGEPAEAVVRAACAVELLHVCALIHDDIMDGSSVRRGRSAVHVAFAELHRRQGWRGDPAAFGEAAALLLGDMAFVWADVALAEAGLAPEQLAAALRVFNRLRTEVMGGQYLDLLEASRGEPGEEGVRRVLTYKSGKYTVERPLHLGSALAGGGPELARAYSAYGLPLGEAFQLRDDVLGVFGSPELTGKPAGDDLREGKETFLVSRTRARAGPAGQRLLRDLLGRPDLGDEEVDQLRNLIVECGALEETEARIAGLVAEAKAALAAAPLRVEEARAVLAELADFVTSRTA